MLLQELKKLHIEYFISKLLEAGKSVIYAGFEGISGTSLSGGSNFHSHNNVPLNPRKGMELRIKKNSARTKKLIN